MSYTVLCNKKIGHQVRLAARSDRKTRKLVPASIDGNGNVIKNTQFFKFKRTQLVNHIIDFLQKLIFLAKVSVD